MVDDRLAIGDELDVRIHRARVVGLLHIQPGRTGDVLVGYELAGLCPGLSALSALGRTPFTISRASRREPLMCPFPNQVALKLSERAEDMENELPTTCCSIDRLLQAF